jgi:hypothetical protein
MPASEMRNVIVFPDFSSLETIKDALKELHGIHKPSADAAHLDIDEAARALFDFYRSVSQYKSSYAKGTASTSHCSGSILEVRLYEKYTDGSFTNQTCEITAMANGNYELMLHDNLGEGGATRYRRFDRANFVWQASRG